MSFLIYPFKRGKKYFIYDTNTNFILKVNKDIFRKLKENDHSIPIFQKFQKKYGIFKENIELEFCIGKDRKEQSVIMKNLLNTKLKRLVLSVTERCNLRCNYCIYGGKFYYRRTHSEKVMNEVIATKAVNFFMNRSFDSLKRSIIFYGGEPFLNFDLIERVVNYVKSNGGDNVKFLIISNGTILPLKFMKFLVENNIYLTVSLDGPEDVHDKERRFISGEGTFSKIMDNLMLFWRKYNSFFETHISFNCTISGKEDLIKIYEFFKSLPFNYLRVNVQLIGVDDSSLYEKYYPVSNKFNEEMKYLRKLFIKYLLEMKNPLHKYMLFLRSLFEKPLRRIHLRKGVHLSKYKTLYPLGMCTLGAFEMFVTTDGVIYPCEKLDTNFRPLGDIKNGFDINGIIKILEEFENILNEVCNKCFLKRLCSACVVMAQKGKEIKKERLVKWCKYFKKMFDKAFKDYVFLLEKNPKILDYYFLKNSEGSNPYMNKK